MNKIDTKNNPGDFVSGFAYPNNAIIENDFLYLRDENGAIIDGKVTVGDKITVLKVIEEKKLALVQYPVGAKVKQGYVTNSTNIIKYFNQDKWINKNTKTDVYADKDLNERIGSVDPNERATLLYKDYGKWYIVYSTVTGKNSKSGFVNFDGGGLGGSTIQPGDIVPEGFTYANNAIIENDFLYLRDENGNQIAGRTVSVGDKITVLDISYSKQLALVQYPTSSGVRQGYVTNSTNIIKYLNPYNWYNGSTAETVYLDATGNSTFGTVNPYEAATLLYKKDSKYHIVYDTSKGMLTKSGYVNFKGLNAPASNITIPSISLNGVEKIQYGASGNGRPLNAYKIGNGSKILFAGFAIHGFEDNWFRDGEALVKIATELVHKFASYNQTNGLHGWSVYIGQCMNPDGVIQGVTNNGPGRCAVTTGIDLNRSFPTGFVVRTDSRYKTGPNPLGAIEALSLKNFISDLHSKASEMVVIDGHGWLNCTYGNSSIASYFTRQFGFSYNGGAGGGFFARWAESLSNTRAVLVEYPSSTRSYNDVLNGNYIGKTYNAMLNIIRDNPGTGGGSGSGNNEEDYYKNAEVKPGTTAVNIRKGPSTNTEKLGTLAGRAKLDISRRIKPSGDIYYWYRIIFEGNYAYIREDFVTILSDAVGEEEFYKNAEVKAGTTAVNIRKGPSTNTEILGTLAGGAKLDISRRIKPSCDSYYWYRIIFEGKYAYIREDFVTILSDVVGEDYDTNENYHRLIELTKPFMKGADIKRVQNRLNKLGFNVGSEDGIYGYYTEEQVIKFKKNKGLSADGKVGPATWDALMNTSSSGGSESGFYDPNGSYHRVLRYQTPMMMGEDVKAVQKKLNEKISSGLSIDGSFGQGTEREVKEFQQKNNLTIDGIVGQNTWDSLNYLDSSENELNNLNNVAKEKLKDIINKLFGAELSYESNDFKLITKYVDISGKIELNASINTDAAIVGKIENGKLSYETIAGKVLNTMTNLIGTFSQDFKEKFKTLIREIYNGAIELKYIGRGDFEITLSATIEDEKTGAQATFSAIAQIDFKISKVIRDLLDKISEMLKYLGNKLSSLIQAAVILIVLYVVVAYGSPAIAAIAAIVVPLKELILQGVSPVIDFLVNFISKLFGLAIA